MVMGASNEIGLRPRGPFPPAPSPLVPRGEGEDGKGTVIRMLFRGTKICVHASPREHARKSAARD